MHAYEWAIVRLVPRVERCEFINVGAVVYCQALDFLDALIDFDEARARALDPYLDVAAVRAHLDAIAQLCSGGSSASGARSQGDRFRWLTAPRSTVVQTSPIHTGLTTDPARELTRLVDTMVRLSGG